jgi:hypothetical protein
LYRGGGAARRGRSGISLALNPGMHGNLIEVACRLLADKDVSTLQKDFGIKVTDPICTNLGKDAPAPNFNELRK